MNVIRNFTIATISKTWCVIDSHHEWDQVLHLLRPSVRSDVLFIDTKWDHVSIYDSINETSCYIIEIRSSTNWHDEWHQVLHLLKPWARADVLFIDNEWYPVLHAWLYEGDQICYHWDHEWPSALLIDTMSESRCSNYWDHEGNPIC
jgi:hypothetical protein